VSQTAYFDAQPIKDLAIRRGPAPDSSAFVGVPRKHPYDDDKFMLFCEPLSDCPRLLEFRLADVVGTEDLPSPVTESGESLPLLRIWVRRGSRAVRCEPFEVDDPPRSMMDSQALRDRVMQGLFKAAP